MASITEVFERFASMNFVAEVQFALVDTQTQLILMQQKQRMEEGVDKKGWRLPPYKMKGYREMKLEAGHNDVTDLTLTGALNEAMFIDMEGEEFTIDSRDGKLVDLEEYYNKDIMGLAPDYMAQFIERYYAPTLIKRIEAKTGLKFT